MKQYYVLYPGAVTCRKSGQTHYVSASTLARLYGVDMQDCLVFDPDPHNRLEDYDACIHLHPQYDEDGARPGVVALYHSHSMKLLPDANRGSSPAPGA